MLPPPRGRDEIESVLSCNRFSFSLETFRILFRFVVSTEEQFLRYLNVASRHKLVVHRPGFCTCVVDAVFRLYDKSATDKERLKWLQWIHHYLERQVNKGMSVPKQAIENTMYRLAIRGQVKVIDWISPRVVCCSFCMFCRHLFICFGFSSLVG